MKKACGMAGMDRVEIEMSHRIESKIYSTVKHRKHSKVFT